MCLFSRPIKHVSKTNIFARALPDGDQILVYSMHVELAEELAMVLPLPLPAAPAEDALEFINLEGCADFFEDLSDAFPSLQPLAPSAGAVGRSKSAPAPQTLKVHKVGKFVASFVPRREDFDRLDARFHLPDNVFERLPQYADYSFAVFQLKPQKKGGLPSLRSADGEDIHPMAMRFPRRDPSQIFYPTMHLHDGELPVSAAYDHTLYCQPGPLLSRAISGWRGWQASTGVLGAFVDVADAAGVIDAGEPGYRVAVGGDLPNQDIFLESPPLTLEQLDAERPLYRLHLHIESAFRVPGGSRRDRLRRENARAHMTELAETFPRALDAWVAEHAEKLGLITPTEDLAPHYMNGKWLWSGPKPPEGERGEPGGAGRLLFRLHNQKLDDQHMELGFQALPTDEACEGIQNSLSELLQAVIATYDPPRGSQALVSHEVLLLVKPPHGRVQRRRLQQGSELIFGRGRKARVVIDDPKLSRKHCVFRDIDGVFHVQDLDSRNKTMLNGEPVLGVAPIRYGDWVEIGETRITIQ